MPPQLIRRSVGESGANNQVDVLVVQELIGLRARLFGEPLPLLAVDGRCGPRTIDAIRIVQRSIVGFPRPTGFIDTAGATVRTLTLGFKDSEISDLRLKHASGFAGPRRPLTIARQKAVRSGFQVRFASTARPAVGPFTVDTLRTVMRFAEIRSLLISTTRRTVREQAQHMYNLCRSQTSVKNAGELERQRGWSHGPAGRKVEEIYYAQSSMPEHHVVSAMESEIETLQRAGHVVSPQCVDPARYATYNAFELAISAVPCAKRAEFNSVLADLAARVVNAPSSSSPLQVIDKVTVTRDAWRLEIRQLPRQLPQVFAP